MTTGLALKAINKESVGSARGESFETSGAFFGAASGVAWAQSALISLRLAHLKRSSSASAANGGLEQRVQGAAKLREVFGCCDRGDTERDAWQQGHFEQGSADRDHRDRGNRLTYRAFVVGFL
jgi:hypothetical protein